VRAKLKPYDVDPASMTLSEIYDLPDSYFECGDPCYSSYPILLSEGTDTPVLVGNAYNGKVRHTYGGPMFDLRSSLDDGPHDNCHMCSVGQPSPYMKEELSWFWDNKNALGSYWTDGDSSEGPYERPHP